MTKKGELVNEVIGSYKITNYLGAGGMSEGVYLATHTKLENKVAIKVMDIGGGTTTEDRRKRIMDEPRKTARLNHPNIVRIIDLLEEGPRLFMVMDYLPGKTLFDYMREDRTDVLQSTIVEDDRIRLAPLENRVVGSFITQIGWALDYAHNQSIIHRDVKPSNIIITETANELRAVLTDFGIAKALEATELSVTREGVGIGTPPYMSPEQIKGLDLTEASDEYSLAIVAYEMLTGRVPFEGESQMVIAHKHISEDPPAPREINPNITEQTEKVLLKALSKEPKKRYGRPGLFADELAKTLVDSTAELNLPSRSFGQRLFGSRGWGFIRGFWRSAQSLSNSCTTIFMRSIVYMIIGTILFLAILATGSIFLASRFIEERVYSTNWRFNDYQETGMVILTEGQMIGSLNRNTQLYIPGILDNITMEMKSPDKFALSGKFLGSEFDLNGLIFLNQTYPRIQITKINNAENQLQLFALNTIVGGFNRGIKRALDHDGAKITDMVVDSSEIVISIDAPTLQSEIIVPNGPADGFMIQDDFSDLSSGWPRTSTVEAAYLSYEDGKYKIEVLQPNFMVIQDYPHEIRVFDMSVDIFLQSGSAYETEFGLVFAKQDSDKFINLVITGDNFLAVKAVENGNTTFLYGWEQVGELLQDSSEFTKLRIINDGQNITVFVFDTELSSFPLPSVFSNGGRFGLYARTAESVDDANSAVIYFDNLSISVSEDE